MKRPVDAAKILAVKAEEDWTVAEVCLRERLPVSVLCFHCQQAAEKLLKAYLTLLDMDFPWTHDLQPLLRLAGLSASHLDAFREPLEGFSGYAVRLRYDVDVSLSREEAAAAFETVGRLRAAIHALLPPEARP
jgi:HEPN domain-containing protein